MTEGQHASQAGFSGQGAGQSLWQTCIDQLAQELPEQQFNTWIKPLSAQVTDDLSKVTIFVANRFKLDWIRAQYSNRISSLLEKYSGQSVQIELALAPREAPARTHSLQRAVEPIAMEETSEPGEDRAQNDHKNRLNSALTFDTPVSYTHLTLPTN